MNISWGNKILIAILAFVTMMGTLVYKCLNTNYELVSKEYYKDELDYQKRIEAANRAQALNSVASVNVNSESVLVELPDEMRNKNITGSILFYCATDASKDRTVEMKVSADGQQSIEKSVLRPGNYTVKMNWIADGQSYYSEKNVKL